MSAEQQHGKSFETLVRECSGMFPRAAEAEIEHISVFDVPADLTEDGIPVSIKIAKCDPATGLQPTLALSDARRFFAQTTTGMMRLVAGVDAPEGPMIRVFDLHDMILSPDMRTLLWGELSAEDIGGFSGLIHDWAVQDSSEGNDKRTRAQKLAKRHKGRLMQRGGIVALNQKINSTNHRLQCSVNLTHLRCPCVDKGNPVRSYTSAGSAGSYGNLTLPIVIAAGRRGVGTRSADDR